MERKLFLNSNKSVFSVNKEGVVNTTLSNKTRTLPNQDLKRRVSLYEQYNKERDECKNFRLILNINPVCSNVLFNFKTEIIKDEGTDDAKYLYDDASVKWKKDDECSGASNSLTEIGYYDAIRNTEYSHPKLGGFIYHCGVDIFNNHMLRNNGFVHINKGSDDKYNTIEDFARYGDGTNIKQVVGVTPDSTPKDMHLYQMDTTLTMEEAFSERCKEKDGWWGFYNPSYINVKNRANNPEIKINQLISTNKPCEFIDLYPDRSLFSFNPKFNKYRRRIEKNWDYCITYPYKNDTEIINTICGTNNGSIKVIFKETYNSNGIKQLHCETYFKHTLKKGDYVVFYYKDDEGNVQQYNIRVKVQSVGNINGDFIDRIFSVNFNDIISLENILYIEDNGNKIPRDLFYKKNVGGVNCKYYARKFKKIGGLKSDINRVAFGKNIYGDDISQIVFTDDIDINGLVDNNGRQVSEVYLTIVKRNAGYEDWANSGICSGSTTEYSHCFGKVTSGIEFVGVNLPAKINEPKDYNIHKLHNVELKGHDVNVTKEIWGDGIEGNIPESLNKLSGITINDDEFYGDFIELDISTYKETNIGDVFHRFNTVQRESVDRRYKNIYHDVFVSDDYDFWADENTSFKIQKEELNKVGSNYFYGNINPEGYFYKPHYKIKLISEGLIPIKSEAKVINFDKDNVVKNGNTLTFVAPTNFGFYKGDNIAFFNINDSSTSWLEIINVKNGTELTVKDEYGKVNISTIGNYFAFWSPNNVPTYAKLSLIERKFVWRKLTPQSELMMDDELYNTPFSNGRLYIENNINFFLRRQDPTGEYGLSKPINATKDNKLNKFIIEGHGKRDFSVYETIMNNNDVCW